MARAENPRAHSGVRRTVTGTVAELLRTLVAPVELVAFLGVQGDSSGVARLGSTFYAGVMGAVLASFLCVVAERVPAGQSINGRSRCTCGHQLHVTENIPIIAWLALRGRARCCGSRIPARYVIAEACLALWFAGAAWAFGLSPAVVVAVVGGMAGTVGVLYAMGRTDTPSDPLATDSP